MQDPRDTTAASRFGQLYNKLASQVRFDRQIYRETPQASDKRSSCLACPKAQVGYAVSNVSP